MHVSEIFLIPSKFMSLKITIQFFLHASAVKLRLILLNATKAEAFRVCNNDNPVAFGQIMMQKRSSKENWFLLILNFMAGMM